MTEPTPAVPELHSSGTAPRALRPLFAVENVLVGAVLVLLVTVTIAGVIMRYVLHEPLPWLIEMQLTGMVWVAFLGAAVAFRYGGHVAIELVVDALPARARAVAEVLIAVIVYALLVYLFVSCLSYLDNFVSSGRSTPILGIPYYIVYGVAPLSCVLMAISYTTTVVAPALRLRRNASEGAAA